YKTMPLVAGPPAEELLLAWLRSDQLKAWRDLQTLPSDLWRTYTYATHESQVASTLVEGLVRLLAGKPYPAAAPPEWMAGDEERVRE
ncbi:hypothetical protein, partial [Escherichia coli]|uniref:hypothetical protein n=1 Tax=Escherichia coli TaxID=562 RepID=UPI001C574369